MTQNDILVNWYYFRSLAKQLCDTEQFVDHALNSSGDMINAATCSNEFAKILMLSSSEFEVMGKTLCSVSGVSLPWNANIVRITKEILRIYPNIGETLISTPYMTIQPLINWKIVRSFNSNGKLIEKIVGIQWWEDHNVLKHDRRKGFCLANLHNCIYATASLMVLELYISQRVLGNLDKITMISCNYFDCGYGLAHIVANPGKMLPDFVKAEN